MEARQFSLPQHLAAQCSDKILMHINRPSNFQQTIDLSFEDFSSGFYTDVTLVPDDGEKIKMHGFLLSAASPFLCDVFSNTFSPNLEYCILLPGVSSSVVSCLAQLLYGATVITCRETLVQLYRLVDILGIQLSLVTTNQEVEETVEADVRKVVEEEEEIDNNEPEEDSLASYKNSKSDKDIAGDHDNHKIKVETNSVKMLKIDDKNNIPSASPVAEETVGAGEEAAADGSSLPLCCWHCSLPFPSFPSLSSHQCCTSTTAPLYRRHHRCPQCGDLLSSMWRLRQHLATHQQVRTGQAGGRGSSDHPYGRSSRRVQPYNVKVQPGDHGYATATLTSHPTMSSLTVQETADGTPPGSAVHSEHSYGTKRDSSPEDEQRTSFEKTDHIYSAADIGTETSKDTTGAVGDLKTPTRQDHQYFQHSERSSPRFRKLLPKEESSDVSKPSTAASFPCANCDKSFPQAYRLKRHIREVHDKEKMFNCEECSKKFFKSNSLARHKIAVHDKIRPFSCLNCDSRFKDRSALKYHTKKNVCIMHGQRAAR
eukprot:GFUD01027814.1.p1 GENE.GFUD01027814.1~~GFUD01027814.1.p1  ORF type:complete len:540 (-),score=152.12 GFUD01027814.1:589-2208(-)